jgi:hypothetical protein
MWAKGMLIIGCGMFIDFLMIAFAWAFESIGAGLQAITPAGGGVAGAAIGAKICWNSSTGVISGLLAATKCGIAGFAAGGLASALGIPLGMALTAVSDVCISLTLGSAFIAILFITGYFKGNTAMIWGVYIGKTIPFLDVVPGYTALAIRCVLKNNKAQRVLAGANIASDVASGNFVSALRTASSVASAGQSISNPAMSQAANASESNEEETKSRAPLNLRSPSIQRDITPRAANDNHPQTYVQAA